MVCDNVVLYWYYHIYRLNWIIKKKQGHNCATIVAKTQIIKNGNFSRNGARSQSKISYEGRETCTTVGVKETTDRLQSRQMNLKLILIICHYQVLVIMWEATKQSLQETYDKGRIL